MKNNRKKLIHLQNINFHLPIIVVIVVIIMKKISKKIFFLKIKITHRSILVKQAGMVTLKDFFIEFNSKKNRICILQKEERLKCKKSI